MRILFRLGNENHGVGSVNFEWNPHGTLIATAGVNRQVNIFSRQGSLVDSVYAADSSQELEHSNGSTVGGRRDHHVHLSWNYTGDLLAVANDGGSTVMLWRARTKEVQSLDSSMRGISCLRWNTTAPVLAIGTNKGNLMFYNALLGRKVPMIGRHTEAILHASWTRNNILATTSSDRKLSLSKGVDGDSTAYEIPLQYRSTMLGFSDQGVASVSAQAGDDSASVQQTGAPRRGRTPSQVAEEMDPQNRVRSVSPTPYPTTPPKKVSFSDKKVMLAVAGSKVLYVIDMSDFSSSKTPFELSFQDFYGEVKAFEWFGDRQLLVAFSKGYIVVLSSHSSEVSEEFHSKRYFRDRLEHISFCPAIGQLAAIGGNVIKLLDVYSSDFKDIVTDALELPANLVTSKAGWTADGQVLAVATETGDIFGILARLPFVSGTYGGTLVHLTSLQEISVVNVLGESKTHVIEIDTEPSFVGVGVSHIAVGIYNEVWFYRLGTMSGSKSLLVSKKEYMGSVTEIHLNARCAAALIDGRLHVHSVEADEGNERNTEYILPTSDEDATGDITSVAISDELLFYGTQRGTLHCVHIDTQTAINDFSHLVPCISRVVPNPHGTRLLFMDSRDDVFLYNPVSLQLLAVPLSGVTSTPLGMLWDLKDGSQCFIVFDTTTVDVFTYATTSVEGARIRLVESAPLRNGKPVILYNGRVTSQLQDGTVEHFVVPSHSLVQDGVRPVTVQGTALPASAVVKATECFKQYLQLLQLQEAWKLCILLEHEAAYEELACCALEHLEIALAEKCYRRLGNAGMVMSIRTIAHVEETNLLAGHVLILLERDYDRAQEYFFASSTPCEALEMRKDLKHWEEALRLSEELDPAQVSSISLEYAATLEVQGDAAAALVAYERALRDPLRDASKDTQCKEGISRVSLMMGDVRRGRRMSVELNSKSGFRDSAVILENMNQLSEAAEMYIRAEMFEKAAELYIASKNFTAAAPILARKELASSKLHGHLARAHEAEGRFKEAAAAYRSAGDVDNEVRLCLHQLDAPEKAFAIVRDSRSVDAADVVANYCKASGDMRGAVEFLLIAKKNDEAFEIASAHEEVDRYASLLGPNPSLEDAQRTARYYESRGESLSAGKMYSSCKMYEDALRMFMSCGDQAIELAIGVVGTAKSDILTHQLIDYITHSDDRAILDKSNDYLFRLHLALGNYESAAKMAFLISKNEQESGNYKVAHGYLLDTMLELKRHGIAPSSEYSKALLLLHSYILVRGKVRDGDHATAARLLVRVAKNISKFPSHVIPILTSTVIECQRANMKKTAYEYACVLMRPEYRSNITPEYKRKIENIVRKSSALSATDAGGAMESDHEATSDCPYCGAPGSAVDLDCSKCMTVIPYCIVTGMRMKVGDWTKCPKCEFPATQSAMLAHVQTSGTCPMCQSSLSAADVAPIDPL